MGKHKKNERKAQRRAEQEEAVKKQEREMKDKTQMFEEKWAFTIPGKENMQKIGNYVLETKQNIRGLLYFPWTDFYMEPTIMMTDANPEAVRPELWVHSLKVYDVYVTLELLSLQYINAITSRWEEWLKKDGLTPDSLDAEVDLFKKVDLIYITAHKNLLAERTAAVEEYREAKKVLTVFNDKFRLTALTGVAQVTLSRWIRATEMFFHFMILLQTPIATFLEARTIKYQTKSDNANVVYVNAFENFQKAFDNPLFTEQEINVPTHLNKMYNEFISKRLMTNCVLIAPEDALTKEMRAYMAAANKNVDTILSKLDEGMMRDMKLAEQQQTEAQQETVAESKTQEVTDNDSVKTIVEESPPRGSSMKTMDNLFVDPPTQSDSSDADSEDDGVLIQATESEDQVDPLEKKTQ